ncbi:phosphomannomutase/phosphoglucomutase [Hasllibacter halocynthiae]|uniref:Phosphomannomutase/phosphoglucomutase n=1 Tax=Hasllibacter halocynthiae TaxID=595589 RepID=A0A2T0X9U0_9RHOB|nr:phosphomannomutase/phosphoglucomutase [Hasllibacter halocynthiae]PRY95712.1 phosphomannomutase/phosphoglucomutase [Hasllibacter halocynthiae]
MTLVPTGFRECDGRWRTPEEIDAEGMERVGMAFAAMARRRHGDRPGIVTGHDFRREAADMHRALLRGLVAGGVEVLDCGLALSPMVYHHWLAQGTGAGAAGCAMVTASHNPDGWTGVKLGLGEAPSTFGPEDMSELRGLALGGAPAARPGLVRQVPDAARSWLQGWPLSGLARPLRAVVACGNGTAAAFVPDHLETLGVEVVPLGCELDWTFPLHHPDPDATPMQRAMADAIRKSGAEIAVGFDGDGDRLGAVDGRGRVIPGDRLGLILARGIAAQRPGSRFLVDIKSTGLWARDPVLAEHGARVEFGPTGHSHMKRRLREMRGGAATAGAVAGFERSGHMFLGHPCGQGFDDAPAAAARLLEQVARDGPLADLADALPRTWATPPHAPACPDAAKPAVAARLRAALRTRSALGGTPVAGAVEAGGTRLNLQDGSWGLIRASQNTPNLVVMAESTEGPAHRDAILADLAALLGAEPEVGALGRSRRPRR